MDDESEDNSQSSSKVFSVRIVCIDYYMAPPIPDYDICYSSFQGGSVKEVPVIRIYGSTPSGQKACVHVHRALPYLYVPCSDIPLQSNLEGDTIENAVFLALEKALKLKGSAGSKRQHVHSCALVRAKKFYGYHLTEELFVKIYLYYPQDVSRAANLLLGGAVFEKCVQPYESHIPFLLQYMVDYNLYGMGHMHLVKMKFRHPVRHDHLCKNPVHINPESIRCGSSDSQADVTPSSQSSLVWGASSIPNDWVWHHPDELDASLSHLAKFVKRQSTCELEGDATVDDILNQQCRNYTSMSQTQSDLRMVQSLIPIWEEEFERTGMHQGEMLADLGKPLAQDVLRSLSNVMEYEEKLGDLYCRAEITSLPVREEDMRDVETTQDPLAEGILSGTGTQKLSDQTLRSTEAIKKPIVSQNVASDGLVVESAEGNIVDAVNTTQVTKSLDLKVADPEDMALLKWLASSQAAEELNSDDELRQDTFLNPLLPAATIDDVLAKASTDYENQSQQECQDILDSMEDDKEARSSPVRHPKSSVALSSVKTIPQLDGADDDEPLVKSPHSSERVAGSGLVIPELHHLQPGSSSVGNKRKRHKVLWGSLPFSSVEKTNDDIQSGVCSLNVGNKSSSQPEIVAIACSPAKCEFHSSSDSSSKDADLGGCSLVDSTIRLDSSVRDLMRKKRCLRMESSEHVRSEDVEEGSKIQSTPILPEKLQFQLEQQEKHGHIVLPVEAPASIPEMHNEAEVSTSSAGKTARHSHVKSPTMCSEGKLDSTVYSFRSSPSCVDMCDHTAGKTCSKSGDDNDIIVGGQLGHRVPSCSTLGSRTTCVEDNRSDELGRDSGIHAQKEHEMISQGVGEMHCTPVGKVDEEENVEQFPCTPVEPLLDLVCGEKGVSGYIRMTFHKKPPVGNWMGGQNITVTAHSSQPPLEDDSDDEEIPDQIGGYEDVPPFFTDSSEQVLEQSCGCNDLKQKFPLGVPTHYQNDGSCVYLLTTATTPPSVEAVLKWLVLNDKADICEVPLPVSSREMSSEPMNDQPIQDNLFDVDVEGGPMTNELVNCQLERARAEVKEVNKLSEDVSQLSGPSGQLKPTPLSQIGFRDPASIGAGQQLTLLSLEVQAESRGDLRPDPRYDAVNVIVLAFQNDNCSSVDIHVLLRSMTETFERNVDGVSGGKLLICSDEKGLLDQFINMTCFGDPDIIMGWDIQGSSLGYLSERAAYLGVGLLNKISRTPSETKTVKRDPKPSVKESSDAVSSESLISDTVSTVIEDEWGRTHASGIHVGGRIILNVWRLMRGEVKLNMYTIESVAEAVLRRKVPSIQWKILQQWFSSGPERARFRCIEYMMDRAKLNLDIVNQLDMINRTSELARVFGIDFFSVLSRGSQYRVESMLVRLAHSQNYVLISPGNQQVASQPAMECLPLVMEPESSFYSDPVIVLDFQSLYPSMIIAYNLCFCTCLGNVVPSKSNILGVSSYSPDMHTLKDLNQQILVTPNGVMYVPHKARKGVLPRLLEEILSTRIMVKQAMKKLDPSQKVLHRIFNARQLALKLIANVTYGYTAAGFSGRMPCAELADSIVQCGRRTLEHAISVVNTNDQWNARVVYGDTDSMFVLLKGRTVKEALQIGQDIASTITALNPNPVTLKMEKVYQSCFLLTKKRYVGYSYESLDQPRPMFDAKGIETVRRDTCGAVAKMMEKSLRTFFEHQDISKVKAYLQRQWSRILGGRVSLQDFVFAKEVRLGTYSTRMSSLPPAAIVASKAMRADPRAEPRYAERVPYVVVHGEPGARLIDMVVDPHELLAVDSPYRLNDLYYITKQIIPALQRVFGLVGADLRQWYQEMPRLVRDAPTKHHLNAANSLRTRIDYYYSSKHCVLCGDLVQATNHLCEKCSTKGPVSSAAMTGITSKLERDIQHLVAICRHCGGEDWLMESGVKCTSLACSVYYERRKVQKELRAFSSVATDAGFYPKCMVEWF